MGHRPDGGLKRVGDSAAEQFSRDVSGSGLPSTSGDGDGGGGDGGGAAGGGGPQFGRSNTMGAVVTLQAGTTTHGDVHSMHPRVQS